MGASQKGANMTRAVCIGFCASSGFKLAGIEYGDECYCDDGLKNGASMETVKESECNTRCAGNGESGFPRADQE